MPSGTRSRPDRDSGRCSRRWRLERLRPLPERQRLARDRRAARSARRGRPGSRPTARAPASAAAGCSRSRTPSRAARRRRRPLRRRVATSRHADDQLADQPPAKVRVAVNRAADRARRAGPGLEPGDAVADRPAHQAVDRDAAVGANRDRRRPAATSPPCTRITRPRTPASATSTFEPPPSTVTGSAGVARDASAALDLARACAARTSQSAGPPTLNVVNGASGASRCDARRAERLRERARRSHARHARRPEQRGARAPERRRPPPRACTARTRSSRQAPAGRRAADPR